MSRTWVWIVVGVAIGLAISIGLVYAVMPYYYNNYYYGNYPGALPIGPSASNYYGGYTYGTYPISQVIREVMEMPSYVHVYPNNNTIVFTGKNINLLVVAMGHKRAERLFNATPPPYVQALSS